MNSEYIEDLKSEVTSAPMIEDNLVALYRIKILHKGEELFYFDKKLGKALIVEVQVRNRSVFKKSINKWDDESIIGEDEKDLIMSRISRYFRAFQMIDAVIR